MQWRFAQTFFHRVAQPGCQLKMANLNFTIVTMKDILSTVRHVLLTVQGQVPIYTSTTFCKTARGKAVENLNKVRKCHANVGNNTKILPSERYWISMNTIASIGFLTTDCLKSFFSRIFVI